MKMNRVSMPPYIIRLTRVRGIGTEVQAANTREGAMLITEPATEAHSVLRNHSLLLVLVFILNSPRHEGIWQHADEVDGHADTFVECFAVQVVHQGVGVGFVERSCDTFLGRKIP